MKDCKQTMKKVYLLKAKLLNRMEDNFEWDINELVKKFKKLVNIERKITCQEGAFSLKYSMYDGWYVL